MGFMLKLHFCGERSIFQSHNKLAGMLVLYIVNYHLQYN